MADCLDNDIFVHLLFSEIFQEATMNKAVVKAWLQIFKIIMETPIRELIDLEKFLGEGEYD